MPVEKLEQNKPTSVTHESDALSFNKIVDGFNMNDLRRSSNNAQTDSLLPQLSIEGNSSQRGSNRPGPKQTICEALQDAGYKIACSNPKEELRQLPGDENTNKKPPQKEPKPWGGMKDIETCTKGAEKNPPDMNDKKTPEQLRR